MENNRSRGDGMIWRIGYTILQWSWGIIQTAAGCILMLRYRKRRHEWYHGAYATFFDDRGGGISLGMFIFVEEMGGHEDDAAEKRLLSHEYGHTFQSLMLGPLYLIVIGIPSFIWANASYFARMRHEKGISYYSMWCEKWADRLGSRLS